MLLFLPSVEQRLPHDCSGRPPPAKSSMKSTQAQITHRGTAERGSEAVNTIPGDLEAQQRELLPASPAGRTLLPSPVASAISLWTRSTSLALRVGTVLGGYGFGAAKATTLSSLELGRGILEVILHRAGNEAFLRSNSELQRADAETIMESSLESLHLAMSQVVFWTTAGFHLTGTTFSTISEMSQLTLSYLDSILGSTESSRAIASIITLIRREFNNPATGQPGEKVGVFDLIVGIVGLAYFQRWAWRLIEEENQRLQVDEVLWDVVILNDEEMLDYSKVADGKQPVDEGPNDKVIQTIQQHAADDSSDDESHPETRLKHQIMSALPPGARVAITTETRTTKTITVDVSGTQPSTLTPPPGVELIEETRLRPSSSQANQRWSVSSSDQLLQGSTQSQATYRVVYRVNKNKLRSTEMARGDEEDDDVPRFVEQIDDSDSEDDVMTVSDDDKEEYRPLPPPKSPRVLRAVSQYEKMQQTPAASRPEQGRVSPTLARKEGADKTRRTSLPKLIAETSANQKRPRVPVSPPASSSSGPEAPRKKSQSMQSVSKLLSKKSASKEALTTPQASKASSEKKGGFRNALKKSTGSTISGFVAKDGKDATAPRGSANSKGKAPAKTVTNRTASAPPKPSVTTVKQNLTIPNRGPPIIPRREAPRAPQGVPLRKPLTARALAEYEATGAIPRSPSRASYISIHESRRDSLVSQTDTFSVHSVESYRPVSPPFGRNSMAKSRAERDGQQVPASPQHNHLRVSAHKYTPSIYTVKTTDSQTSLVPYYHRSLFDADALTTLRRTGTLDAMFPRFHLLRNITRFMRFSSASYGSNFLKVFGISKSAPPVLKALDSTHHEVRAFAHHTQSQPQSVLLASFVDPQGGSDSSGSTETGVPLVHYVSIDDESKAVVLACRGTLGFEDVLADMTCDYDDLVWRGNSYKVHKGVHASARRLLYGGDGRVLVTIKAALEENPDYGLVLCGHSLGGAVTALLGVMLSQPAEGLTSFVTSDESHSRLLPAPTTASSTSTQRSFSSHVSLPCGRPIHVYAYGPPSTMCPALRIATRGLITSVVHGQDLVPYLSLGVLHDFQAVALAFKTDNAEAKQEIKQRVWDALHGGLMDKWRGTGGKRRGDEQTGEDEQWAFAAFKTLRASSLSEKLLPPGEVFVVETDRVLRRDAFVSPEKVDSDTEKEGEKQEGKYIGRPARRIVLKYVRDVETRFREIRFGATMLTDHNPAKYEDALDGLRFGVAES